MGVLSIGSLWINLFLAAIDGVVVIIAAFQAADRGSNPVRHTTC